MSSPKVKLVKGLYLAKKNKQVFGRDHDIAAAIRINTINHQNQHHAMVNGLYSILADHVDVITEEEYYRLNGIFQTLQISETGKPGQNNTHYRAMDGKEKLGYHSRDRALSVLYHYRMTKPDDEYDAYLCDVCNKYHMGRLLKENEELTPTPSN